MVMRKTAAALAAALTTLAAVMLTLSAGCGQTGESLGSLPESLSAGSTVSNSGTASGSGAVSKAAEESVSADDSSAEDGIISSDNTESIESDRELSSSAPAEAEKEKISSSSQGGSADSTQVSSSATNSSDAKNSSQSKLPKGESLSVYTNSKPSAAGGLQVIGSQLCDSSGQPVQLRGVSTHGLAWYPEYVNEDFFKELKGWGANVVRLAMYTAEYGGYCSGGDKEALKALVRKGVSAAASAGLYAIVDWHVLNDRNPLTYLEDAKAFFAEMAAEFAGQSHVLYEICNEPNGGTSWADIKRYADEVIPVIRAADPDAVILVGTPTWSQEIDKAAADPLAHENVMYTLHFYAATHTDSLRRLMVKTAKAGLPLFVSEFGICDASGSGGLDEGQAEKWLAAMDELGISYVAWNLSNKNETSAIFKESCKKTAGFTADDLSPSGRWVYEMLSGGGAGKNLPMPSEPSEPPVTSSEASEPPAVSSAPVVSSAPAVSSALAESAPVQTANADFRCEALLVNSWENGGQPFYQYELTVYNDGAACESWAVTLKLSGSVTLSDSWNGQFALNGGSLTIRSMDYNGSIPAGGQTSNIGFIVSGGCVVSGE